MLLRLLREWLHFLIPLQFLVNIVIPEPVFIVIEIDWQIGQIRVLFFSFLGWVDIVFLFLLDSGDTPQFLVLHLLQL